jgi:hypothetical protein
MVGGFAGGMPAGPLEQRREPTTGSDDGALIHENN